MFCLRDGQICWTSRRSGNGHQEVKLSSEWINTKICSYGASRADQLRSLRKKIWDHRKSSAHNEAHKILETRDKDTLKTNVISQKAALVLYFALHTSWQRKTDHLRITVH